MAKVIYMLEGYTDGGDLVVRRFLANKKSAEKVALHLRKGGIPVEYRKLNWREAWVDPKDVERL